MTKGSTRCPILRGCLERRDRSCPSPLVCDSCAGSQHLSPQIYGNDTHPIALLT
ncbi:hypothetical protein H6G51_06330 [Limnothrix sp. FACHB-708]|uniref:hypothetical protein n=1 Tax=unclassified Limnothrix TaxID=2632864 RepID=UPI0016888491|nr:MULTISPECIES: hypothetical protein [unclassified Limnothrix]MBD2552888.1 hypothetical protein [Limnothrix sp. FACHB-708]MBD2589300.1 hypothetical protein [Limnothrix sp. FACHB-406]